LGLGGVEPRAEFGLVPADPSSICGRILPEGDALDGWRGEIGMAQEGPTLTAIPIYPRKTSNAWQLLSPLASRWTYTRILYLLLSFPLGVAYFVLLTAGGVTGGALIWTWFGLVILIALVLGARWAGDLEAVLNHRLVGVEIRRPPTWYERDVPIREQAKQILLDPSTWTALVYLASRFPLGITAFVSTVMGVTLPLTLLFAPVTYQLYDVWGDQQAWLEIFGWQIDTAGEAWAVVPIGFVSAFIALHVLNLEAWLLGRWAKLMLGSRARDIPPPPAALADADAPALPASGVTHPLVGALTPREREVLLLIARGYSNAEIAESFVVSEGTVKTHVKRILAKLEVRDRTQAAVFAFDSGFVTPESASEPEPR